MSFSDQPSFTRLRAKILLVALALIVPAVSAAPSRDPVLRYQVGGHVLGFGTSGLLIASADHALKIDWAGGRAASPAAANGEGFGRVAYENIWPAVTLIYEKSESGLLKSTYQVEAGAPAVSAASIRLHYNRPVRIDSNGDLVVVFDQGEMRERAPVAWQTDGRHKIPVDVSYRLVGDREIGFSLGGLDPSLSLVIDPELAWHSFFGGASLSDHCWSVALSGSDDIVVLGGSQGPWGSPINPHSGGYYDYNFFVVKLSKDGTLAWHTFVGGGYITGADMVVDDMQNIYVVGKAIDPHWPDPLSEPAGLTDAMLAKLNPDGSFQWLTYIGGTGNDEGLGLVLDAAQENVYISGTSNATWGSPIAAFNGGREGFVAKIGSDGTQYWHTYFGSSGNDYGGGIVLTSSGLIVVTGSCSATWGSPVNAFSGGQDACVVAFNDSGVVQWNTFLGGSSTDSGWAIAANDTGAVYILGSGYTSWGSPVRAYTAYLDIFVAKINGSGALVWNTFLGGSNNDYLLSDFYDHGGRNGIALDADGNVFVTGMSNASWGSPVLDFSGSYDFVLAKLDGSGNLSWHLFLGSSTADDGGTDLVTDESGNIFCVGYSWYTWGSPLLSFSGTYDQSNGFVSRIANISLHLTSPNGGETWAAGSNQNITWTTTGTVANVKIEYSTNAGTSYTTIMASTPNSGSYAWAVPNMPSVTCLVRVSDAANAAINDSSNASFSIVVGPSGALTVTSPNGGESWAAGSSQNITWTTTGTVANVKIEYSTNNGANWTPIVASTANLNSLPWTVPNTPATTCLVRISDAANAAIIDVSNAVFTITSAAIVKENLLGTWDGQGVYYRNSDTGQWTILSTEADLIACGDLYGDGIDDLIGIWSGQAGVWVKNSANGNWAYLGSSPRHIAAGDMNGDGRADLVGTWDGQGVFYRNSISEAWIQMATPATLITAGDLDGDGKADLIGIWPSQAGVWVKYSQTGNWSYLGSATRDSAVGDMNGDGRVDLVGTWDGQGVFYKDSISGNWVMVATPADQVAAGDLDGDGTDDLIGIWAGQAGVWVKYSQTQTWAYIGSSARDISAGKMAGGAWSTGLNTLLELEMPIGGLAVGPPRGSYEDLSANSPGRGDFAGIIEKNLKPEEPRPSRMITARNPGPGEPGFRCAQQKNLFPEVNLPGDKSRKKPGPVPQ